MNLRRKGYCFIICIGLLVASLGALSLNWGEITLDELDLESIAKAVPSPFSNMMAEFYLPGTSFSIVGFKG